GSDPNYYPNSFDDIHADERYKESPIELDSTVADWYDRNGAHDNDHYTQPGWLFNKAMNDYDRHNLASNIVGAMSGITGTNRDLIVNRQLCHFFRADVKLGTAVAKGLGVNVETILSELKHEPVKI
ncbi:MAG: Catalase, partial [Bacteroidetes bacterium]|nr:Catalase [Bacteroidota bacterium]